ncbi:hypothetical protein GGI04_005234 [Coemansia thaxteri]|nr:hypothetical protein GGI04_005234 [Coemansia thaxteri]KAJ2471814.1 hypothetical protein GGI02_002021 [Coemansia sp. RSA 2322]KAJ2486028.1 hypothetical protein EV174_001372 [Coemansia sp. RSA 2320]
MGLNKESAATSNLDDFEDGDDDDDDNDIDGDPENGESEALLKRRKRNAQSAARLRERRKTREHELTSSCTKLESQIARLEGELSDEKHRAMLDLQSNKSLAAISNIVEVGSSADVAGAPIEEPNSAGPQSQGTKRQWMLVAPNTDREGDYTMGSPEGETAMNESAAERPRNPRKKSKPLRELDQDRLDDLRSKIETLGKLNQQVCVNLGMLRQEIKRISNAITLKRPVASACG